MMNNENFRKNSFIAIITLSLIFTFGCSSDDESPTETDPLQIIISDTCDNSMELSFHVAEASLIPIPKEDLTFENLGQTGAEALASELMSEDGFCSLNISVSAQAIFTQVEQLISVGDNTGARALLSTVLSKKKVGNLNSSTLFMSGEHQKVRDLLRAAAYDQRAGGDGQTFLNDAQSVYSTWAEKYIPEATIQEALRIAAEAQMLGLNDLGDLALDRAVELVKQDVVNAVNNFNPCTATTDDVDELLKKLAKEQLLTGGHGDEYDNVMELAGQAMIQNGVDPEAARQVFGEWIENAVCNGFVFEWTRIVSDGWTFVGEGSSCDGINWEGTVALSGINTSGTTSVIGRGSFSLIVPSGTINSLTTVLTSGTVTFYNDNSTNVLPFTDPLPMTFVFMENQMQAEISIASNGTGVLDTDIGPIPFASVFTTEPTFVVVLVRNANCE